uniref:KH domain-containing protein n=1 Tax=Angiostrongylus cantonensis TaxID=6313 RepID=A0A0K0D155_ANGCA
MKSVSANARFHPSAQNIISSDGTEITIKISIPPEKAGLVIGKKGRTIKLLQKQSGCSMSMIQESKEVTTVPKLLSITGAREKTEVAKRLVRDLLSCEDHSVMSRQYSNKSETKQLSMQRFHVGMVKKEGGERTEQVSLETGIKVHLKADGDPASSTTCAVGIGSRDRMFTVTGHIRELVFYMYVPSSKAGLIIGKKGRTIKQINDETGAYCAVSREPHPNKEQTVFIIRGTAFQIYRAQHIMRIKIGNLPSNAPFSPFTGERAPGAYNFNIPQYNELYGATLWNNAYAQQADNGVGWINHTGQFYAGPTSNTRNTYGAVHLTAAAQFTYTAVHLTADVQNTYNAVQSSRNAQTDSPASFAQWVDYYKCMGLYDYATFVEAQMKQNAALGAAAAAFENPLSSGAASASTLSNANNPTSGGSVGQYCSYFSLQKHVNVARQLHLWQQQQF